MEWHRALGLAPERLQFHQHARDELAHYARAAFDIEFDFGGSLGFQEIEGIHNRGDFDLTRHQEYSGKKLEYFDQPNNRRFVPFVVETSVGADRTALAVLVNAYREEEVPGESEGRTVLGLAPVARADQGGCIPAREEGRHAGDGRRRSRTTSVARSRVFYDDGGAIGRRYRRQDEVGTPFGITIDGQSTQDGTVTVRDRDTLAAGARRRRSASRLHRRTYRSPTSSRAHAHGRSDPRRPSPRRRGVHGGAVARAIPRARRATSLTPNCGRSTIGSHMCSGPARWSSRATRFARRRRTAKNGAPRGRCSTGRWNTTPRASSRSSTSG